MTGKTTTCAVTLLALCSARHLDGQSATQRVTFQVNALNRMAVSGSQTPMAITTVTAGMAPTPVIGSGGTYTLTTNERNQKIIAAIDESLPTGVRLEVALGPPVGAVSSGLVPLGTDEMDVVTGINATVTDALPITYRLSATESAYAPGAQSRSVTFTIIAAP
ncbi:MAG TPA: hypothetical protein VKH19_13360 [Gemmatimonadaceae bacterium]|nr:hypothetical protein [Gemmatimonadaceae bacterium]